MIRVLALLATILAMLPGALAHGLTTNRMAAMVNNEVLTVVAAT